MCRNKYHNYLTVTVKLLLHRVISNYADLKSLLLKEFGQAVGRNDIYRILQSRKWNRTESIHRYVLEMENIAPRCGDFDEFELIGFIIDGMQDKSPESYLL